MPRGHIGGQMLVALAALAVAGDHVTQPATINNAGNGDLNVLSTVSPLAGEEGHWLAVKFEAHSHDLGVSSIDATFVRQPPGPTWTVDCVVDVPHDVIVFTSASPTPPADPEILYRTTIAPVYGHPGGRVPAHVELPEEIFVPKGEYLYAAFELPGSYPAVTCMMLSSDNADHPADAETDFWGFATEAPFAWGGLDVYWTDKVVASVSGLWYL